MRFSLNKQHILHNNHNTTFIYIYIKIKTVYFKTSKYMHLCTYTRYLCHYTKQIRA